MNNKLITVEPEYVYITIPAEYICVYHRILAMLADYGEEMLKDCKAACTDRNSTVIECFNVFNAAVAARKLGKDKLAETLIKYIKAKINQIYKGKDNSTSFVFPIDENGQLKAFVSCGERPRFEINPDDGELYEHKFHEGFDEHFRLGPEDESPDSNNNVDTGLNVELIPRYEKINGIVKPCADIIIKYNNEPIDISNVECQYYFDDRQVDRFSDINNLEPGLHNFTIFVEYNEETALDSKDLDYEESY